MDHNLLCVGNSRSHSYTSLSHFLKAMKGGYLKSHPNIGKPGPKGYTRFEIMDTVDVSAFSPEVIEHYRSHILPLLRKLIPDGADIHFAFLSDPPAIEIRKMVD